MATGQAALRLHLQELLDCHVELGLEDGNFEQGFVVIVEDPSTAAVEGRAALSDSPVLLVSDESTDTVLRWHNVDNLFQVIDDNVEVSAEPW